MSEPDASQDASADGGNPDATQTCAAPDDGSDGCCPVGFGADDDPDCQAFCGNGLIEWSAGEVCEGSCPVACLSPDSCVLAALVGDPSTCTSLCIHSDNTTCGLADGCCPAGCTNNGAPGSDADCPLAGLCGNGQLDGTESCDNSASGEAPCPAACAPSAACKAASVVGSAAACTARCVETNITTVGPADGCCPPGANANDDPDCSAVCGNGVVEPGAGETCEGNCPTSCTPASACIPRILAGDPNGCTALCVPAAPITACTSGDGCCPATCKNDLAPGSDTDCPPSGVCGNGQLDGTESCDDGAGSPTPCPSACVPTGPCRVNVLVGSSVTCSATCAETIITTIGPDDGCCPLGANAVTDPDCTPVCGNGVVEAPEQCDASCPTSCNAGPDACAPVRLQGTLCNRACTATPITAPANDDGCCPPGASPLVDNDCTCAPGTVLCSTGCVDTATSAAHCGSCGNACPAGRGCLAGECRCDDGRLACGGSCFDETTDPNNCNACGAACSSNHIASPTCQFSRCNGTCAVGWADCNYNKLTDGCELDVRTDPINCGGCGVTCSTNHMAPGCFAGVCNGSCIGSYADCDGDQASPTGNGCEIDILADPNHCGRCTGRICSNQGMLTRTCTSGVCSGQCLPGYLDCDNDKYNNGCEVYATNNPSHCGGCFRFCTSTQICQVNQCKVKNGESCVSSSQCASARCSFNICVP